MGNPNARPKGGGLRRFGSSQSNTTSGSAVSPKTASKRKNMSGSYLSNDIIAKGTENTDVTANTLATLALEEISPTRPELKFKSYKTGTLMTNNGVPAKAMIAPLPPPKPSPKLSRLSAASPAFVPFALQRPATTPADVVLPSPVTPAFQRIQNLLHDIRSPNSAGPSLQMTPSYSSYLSPPLSIMGNSSMNVTPSHQLATAPTRPPRTYYQRADKSKKDIIITASGAIRNSVKVVERYLPNGTPYHNYTPEFEAPNYDFIGDYQAMSTKEKADLLAIKQVEIVLKIDKHDEQEKVKEVRTSKGGNAKGKGKKVDLKQIMAEEAAPKIKALTVIDTINALGPDFAANTKNLSVTLDFLSIPAPEQATTPIPTGPRAASPLSPNGPLILGHNFVFVTNLVRTLQTFTGLKHMVVNLRVLSSHNPRPITISQLTLLLPFYDLGFTDWKVSYQPEFLTNSVPIRDHDYPLKWLDRERNKILREREKKLENAVFVRRSSFDGKVANWQKKK